MSPLMLAILLFAIGILLLGAELLIPAHGTTATFGLFTLLAGLVACFIAGTWIGLGALMFFCVVTPVAAAGGMRVLSATPLGRRLILPESRRPVLPAAAPVLVGQTGIAVSALRPSGICEFDDLRNAGAGGRPLRVRAISDFGNVVPGAHVRVICFADGRATVRSL